MGIILVLLVLLFSLSYSSPPTNCKTCYGHFLLFRELKTDEEKKESIEKFCSKYDDEWYYTFPFEKGILKLVKEKGVDYAFEEFNKCKDRKSINELCSNLSGFTCKA